MFAPVRSRSTPGSSPRRLRKLLGDDKPSWWSAAPHRHAQLCRRRDEGLGGHLPVGQGLALNQRADLAQPEPAKQRDPLFADGDEFGPAFLEWPLTHLRDVILNREA